MSYRIKRTRKLTGTEFACTLIGVILFVSGLFAIGCGSMYKSEKLPSGAFETEAQRVQRMEVGKSLVAFGYFLAGLGAMVKYSVPYMIGYYSIS